MQKLFLIAGFFFLTSCQKEVFKTPSIDNDIEAVAKEFLVYEYAPGIEIGIIRNGEKKIYSYGTQNISTQKPFDENTIFEIGSITKTFLAYLYADLALHNVVSLNDSANKYLPLNLKLPSKNGVNISILNILNHTSGLPRDPGNMKNLKDPSLYKEENLSEYLKNLNLISTPGEAYLYSNMAMGISGFMLKQITNYSFTELVKSKMFLPLGMNSTFTENTRQPNTAQGYVGNKPVDFYKFSNINESAGCINSNMHDMFIYLGNAMGLKTAINRDAFELAEKQTFTIDSYLKVGMAWHSFVLNGDEIVWMNGGTQGFTTFLGFNKKKNYGVIVATNSSNLGSDNVAFNVLKILDKYL